MSLSKTPDPPSAAAELFCSADPDLPAEAAVGGVSLQGSIQNQVLQLLHFRCAAYRMSGEVIIITEREDVPVKALNHRSQDGGNTPRSIMLSRWGVKSTNVNVRRINKLSLNLK